MPSEADGYHEMSVMRPNGTVFFARLTANIHSLVPFSYEHQLINDSFQVSAGDRNDSGRYLPGHPRILLCNIPLLTTFLEAELVSDELEKMAPYLWMMSLHSSVNISPLHRQLIKGRKITITEDPILHLVWLPNRIHIKPLPAYLLSFTFWDKFLLCSRSPLPAVNRDRIVKAALGYIRTYYYLIRHESDFFLAQKHHLIPESVSWVRFCAFASRFDAIADSDVSERYGFGELRLTRLNVYCKFVLGQARLHRLPTTTYGAYFSRFYTPFLFVFAVLSVVLNALQVGLAVEPLTSRKWPRLWTMARVIVVSSLTLTLALTLILCVLFIYRFVSEWRHAIWDELDKRRARKAESKNTKFGEAA